MLAGLLLLASLVSPAHAECGDSLDTLGTFLDGWTVDAARGIHSVAVFSNLLPRTPDRTASGPHMGALLELSTYGARLAGQPIGSLSGSPMAQTRLIQALQADPGLARGLQQGDADYRHVILGVHPDAPWSSLVTVAHAASILGLKALTVAYAAPDLASPPPSPSHGWFEELRVKSAAEQGDAFTREIRGQVAGCAALGDVFEAASTASPDDRPALFRARLPGAYATCRCHDADPGTMAELFWNMDGRNRGWMTDVAIAASATPVSLPPTTQWKDAEPVVWAAMAKGPIWPVNAPAASTPAAPAEAPAGTPASPVTP